MNNAAAAVGNHVGRVRPAWIALTRRILSKETNMQSFMILKVIEWLIQKPRRLCHIES